MATYNLASLLEDSARDFPDRTALVFGDTRLPYNLVDAMANMVANGLVARGIKPGDKVALSCPNVPYFTVVYFGILKAGAVVVPLNVLFKAREVAYHLGDSDAVAYFCFEGTADLPMGEEGYEGFRQSPKCEHFFLITADPAGESTIEGTESLAQLMAGQPPTFDTVKTDEDDTAVILYTSGTTGNPKGAELRHRNMRDNALIGRETQGHNPEDPETSLCVLPLFHSFGQTVIQNGTLGNGGTLVLMPRFEAEGALRLMQKEHVTAFGGVPTMFWAMLNALEEHPDIDADEIGRYLRLCGSGGAPLPVEIHREFEKRFGVSIREGYGLSETSPTASYSPDELPAKPGSIGVPLPGVEMRLLKPGTWEDIDWAPDAVGEIAIRGHNVMKGYYGRPEATREAISDDGWFRTGDLGTRDADGWYYIVDRAKDMIIRGGFNVYPREIEEVLMTHPAVSLAAVIGLPSEQHGEEIKAFVILKPGFEDTTPDDIVDWSKANMAAYKYPRIVEIVPELPMTSTGKILKRALKTAP